MIFKYNGKHQRMTARPSPAIQSTEEIFLLRFFRSELKNYMNKSQLNELVFPTFVYAYDPLDNSIQWYPRTSETINFFKHLRKIKIKPYKGNP